MWILQGYKTSNSFMLAAALILSACSADLSSSFDIPEQIGGGSTPPPPPPPAGSQAPVPGTEIVVNQLKAGYCADADGELILDVVTIQDCSTSHEFEVAGILTREEVNGAEYRGRVDILTKARIDCRGLFAEHTGKEINGLGLELDIIYPSATTWAEGDRSIICIILSMDGEPTLDRPAADY